MRKLKKHKISLQARSIFLQGLLCSKNLKKNFDIWNEEFKNWNNFLIRNKIKNNIACANFVFQNKLIDNFVFGFRNIKEFSELKTHLSRYKKKIDYSNLASDDKYLLDPRLWVNLKNKDFRSNYREYKINKEKILFGGMLLSKRTDQFIPGKWPNFSLKLMVVKLKIKKELFRFFLNGSWN